MSMTLAAKKAKPVWGWNIHPGEILREEYMKPLGLSAYALAKELKLTRPRLNDIVLERRAITADTAVRLARYFGTTEQIERCILPAELPDTVCVDCN
jgi:addiction module HigA family antidote